VAGIREQGSGIGELTTVHCPLSTVNYQLFLRLLSMLLLLFCIFQSEIHATESLFRSYRDIPGVTAYEIEAIEELKKRHEYFILGMEETTEAFKAKDGKIGGFAPLLCNWMEQMFGIPFITENHLWIDLLKGLESGKIHFTADLTTTFERNFSYFMTEPIAQRQLKYFSLMDTPPPKEIAQTRPPIYALQEHTTLATEVMTHRADSVQYILIDTYSEAYKLMKDDIIDVFVAENTAEFYFEKYKDVVNSEFHPMIHSPISLSTQTRALAPIISVVQKALEHGAKVVFQELYEKGYDDFIEYKKTNQKKGYIEN